MDKLFLANESNYRYLNIAVWRIHLKTENLFVHEWKPEIRRLPVKSDSLD
jgi:hypothetical protein